MQDYERMERVKVRLGHQVKIWHLNLTGKSQKTLEMIGFKDLLKETIEVYFNLQEKMKTAQVKTFYVH